MQKNTKASRASASMHVADVWLYAHARTTSMWTLGCTSLFCLKLSLRGGYRTVAAFHPLKYTLARRERGIAEREKRKDSRRSASPRTHSHPYLLLSPRADMEHSENKLRLFTACFFLFSCCSCTHISPDRTQTGQGETETAHRGQSKDIRLHRHQKGGTYRFRFDAASVLNAPKEGDTTNAKSPPAIKATRWERFSYTASLKSTLPEFRSFLLLLLTVWPDQGCTNVKHHLPISGKYDVELIIIGSGKSKGFSSQGWIN